MARSSPTRKAKGSSSVAANSSASKRKAAPRKSDSSAKAKAKAPPTKKARRAPPPDDEDEEDEEPTSEEDLASDDVYGESQNGKEEDEEEESEPESEDIDSDDLDDSDDGKKGKSKKRKAASGGGGGKGKGKATPSKKGSSSPIKNGKTTSVTKLVEGPGKDEMVKPGMVAPYTMAFLADLAKPENNDREWLAVNDVRYRAALANWHEWITEFVPKMSEADWTVPTLPYKDLVHRIYRDVRFSQDKTPYKTNFSVGFSRTGRKGPWAGYYLQIKPGGHSLMAGGKWQPEKNDLATIRNAILRNPKPLRKVIGSPEFVAMFGKPEVGKTKPRQNVFGHDDMLKNCPKLEGVTKDHKDIDLLRLRTIAAVKYIPDDVVLSPKFPAEVAKIARALAPLVQLLNDMILPQSDSEGEEDDEDEDDE